MWGCKVGCVGERGGAVCGGCVLHDCEDGFEPATVPERDVVTDISDFGRVVPTHTHSRPGCGVHHAACIRDALLVLLARQMQRCGDLVAAVADGRPGVCAEAQAAPGGGVTGAGGVLDGVAVAIRVARAGASTGVWRFSECGEGGREERH